jgi:hypothetical protein
MAHYPAPLCGTMTSENSGNKFAKTRPLFPELFANSALGFVD